jgi:hypothetical protein
MPYYYTDVNGQRQGPIDDAQLKLRASQGHITPQTPLETDSGHRGLAGQIPGLKFSNAVPKPAEEPMRPHAEPVRPPTSAPQIQGTGDVFSPTPLPKPLMPNGANGEPPQLSRAVFIFLAVLVGIFGIHDFYAKRIRQGWFHMALLAPWILAFLVSIIVVFGYSLYAVCYSPLRKEIWECENAIKTNEKNIKATERKRDKAMRELEAARNGELHKPKDVRPQQDAPREVRPQPVEPRREVVPQQPPEDVRPQPVEPRREVVPRQPPVNIDQEYVRELQNLLRDIERSLRDLEQRQSDLQNTLAGLRVQQGVQRIPAWVSTGPLWLYFFFFVLPLVSWAVAMLEVICITKDGTDNLFGF